MELVHQLLKVFWPLLPIIVCVKLLRSRWFKGFWGEQRVRALLRRLPSRQYQTLSNVTLPTSDGSTQIDHVIVSPYGVFVIETKNMQGLILGEDWAAQWQQQLGSRSRSFQNPLRQNYKHVQTLHELLGIKKSSLFSLIVFVGSCDFAQPLPDTVVQGADCIPWIRGKTQPRLTSGQVQEILTSLRRTRLRNSFSTRRQHIRHVQTVVAQKHAADGSPPCPYCGGQMQVRQAKQGVFLGQSFWGCLAFPSCRGTRNIP